LYSFDAKIKYIIEVVRIIAASIYITRCWIFIY